jgi:hypothetical protein
MRGVRRCGGGLFGRFCATLSVIAGLSLSVAADDGGRLGDGPSLPHFELWTGAQDYTQAWSIYSGASVAPFGSIQEDGMRVRVVGGYGVDNYSGSPPTGGPGHITYKGTTSFADALVGYHSQLGPLTLKLFGGLTGGDRLISPADPAARIHGAGLGGKVVAEGWWNLGDQAWTAVDLSWASLYQSYGGRVRLGWRVIPELSAGVEAGAVGNLDCDIVRAGALLRYELASGEISVTGGVSNDRLLAGGASPNAAASGTPFAMLSWLTRF